MGFPGSIPSRPDLKRPGTPWQRASLGRDPRQAWGLTVLVALCALRFAALASWLRYPDLALDYPFPGGDGLDWLVNGLAWAGHPLPAPTRAPVLPLLLAGLERLGLLSWFPVLHQLVLPAGCVALYFALTRWHPPRVALLATFVPLASGVAANLGLEVMADTLAAVLLFFAILAFLAGARRPRWYVASGALAALSALTQQTAVLLPLSLATTLWACRRGELRRRELWLGAALFALAVAPHAAWSAWRELASGVADSAPRQWALLGWQPRPGFYLGAAAGLWGLPALALATVGLVVLLRRREARGVLVAALAGTLGAFFVLFYGFPAQRFLLYLLLPAAIPLAAGLASLPRASVQLLAGALAIFWAAWPIPGSPWAESRFTVSPLPGLFADAAVTPPALLRVTPAKAWKDHAWQRAHDATPRRPPGSHLDPQRFRDDAVVLYLHGETSPDRYRDQRGLAAALRRRVGWAPASLYPADWWGWEGRRFLGTARGYAFFRLQLTGLTGPAVVAFEQSDPQWRRLRRRPPRPGKAVPSTECLAAAWEQTGLVAAPAGDGDPLVAVLADPAPPEWQRLAPFAVHSFHLFVLTGSQVADTQQELERVPPRVLARSQGVEVLAARLWGRRVLLARSAEDAPSPACDPPPRAAAPVAEPPIPPVASPGP